jgi:transmembrane sensor
MSERIMEEAVAWHAAQADDGMDWDGFTRWLEADPRHREAFDAVALASDAIDRHRDRIARLLPNAAANDDEPAPRGRRWPWLAGGGIAAALALVVGVPMMRPTSAPAPAPAETVYATRGGEQRTVRFADGSTARLAPGSRLAVADGPAPVLTLTGGAYFDIRHDPDRRLTIVAGDHRITDIGTRLDVLSDARVTRVAVAEGQVRVASPFFARDVALNAGTELVVDRKAGQARTRAVAAGDVGAWRDGRLVYDDAPLSLVAADIGRYAGVEVTLAPGLADRRFSGVLTIGTGGTLVDELGRIMGIGVHRRDGAVRLGERER